MFCPKCGAQNADKNKFCLGCGAPLLAKSQVTPEPESKAPTAQVSQTQAAGMVAGAAGAEDKACPLCARSYPASQKFCNADGASLVDRKPASAPVAQQEALAKVQAGPAASPLAPAPKSLVPPSAAQDPNIPAAASLIRGTVAESLACPKCGRTYFASQKFCNVDGATLVAHAPAPAAAPPSMPPPEPLPAELTAAAAPELHTAPAAAPPPHAPSAIEASAEDLACPACGLAFPPGARFCDQDGTTLVSQSIAQAAGSATPPPVMQISEESSWDSGWDELQNAPRKRTYVVAGLLSLAVLIAGGGGYAHWNGYLDKWIGENLEPELASAVGKNSPKSVGTAETKLVTPGLLGSYKAHLSDQDIVLVIEGESPKPLVASAGTVTYLNVVNGGSCTAALVPTSGGGVGGDTGNAVSFQQTPVPGKPNCPQDIPVKMDITGQPADEDGVVGSIAVEWHKPNSENVLMAGKLQRESR